MSGETEDSVSGWTTDTLHVHLVRQIEILRAEIRTAGEAERRAIDLAFAAQTTAINAAMASSDRATTAALDAQKEAVRVAQIAAEKRADIQNEWRQSLGDVLTRAMPRPEAEAARDREAERHAELATRVTRLEEFARGAAGNRASMFAALGVATSIIVAIVVVLNFVIAR